MLHLRDQKRYGKFKAFSEEIGECEVVIGIAGFGESFNVYKDGELIFSDETDFDDDGDFDFCCLKEDKEAFYFRICEHPYEASVEKMTFKRIKV